MFPKNKTKQIQLTLTIFFTKMIKFIENHFGNPFQDLHLLLIEEVNCIFKINF
jgi:hypothetical protein